MGSRGGPSPRPAYGGVVSARLRRGARVPVLVDRGKPCPYKGLVSYLSLFPNRFFTATRRFGMTVLSGYRFERAW